MNVLLLLSLLGCAPKGSVPLSPLATSTAASGTLAYTSSAALESRPGVLDFNVHIAAENTGESPIRIDLTRSRLSVDGQPFLTCRYGSTANPTMLVTNLNKGEKSTLHLTCRDIPRPIQKVEFKFIASGNGGANEIVIGWVGLGERI